MFTLRVIQFAAMVSMIWAACHFINKTDSDKEQEECVHPEFSGFHVKVGSNIKTPDCLNITCFENGMTVCEFGWRLARHVGLPEECTKLKVGDCGVKFVKVKDAAKPCFEEEDDEYNSMPAKK